MVLLVKKNEDGGFWYPATINRLDTMLAKVVYSGRGYRRVYALRRNIGYNLQYLQFLDRTIQDIKMPSVIFTQTIKSFIIIGCGIIESLMNFLLIARGKQKKTEWQLKYILPGNQKSIEGEILKVDSNVYKKLPSPVNKQMTFDAMISKSERHQLFGSDHSIYPLLKGLRQLRNRVHLQEINHETDTDWNAFNRSDYSNMCSVLHKVLTSNIFRPSEEDKSMFNYLLANIQQPGPIDPL